MIKSCHPQDEIAYLRAVCHLAPKGDIAEVGVWNGGTAQILKEEFPDREIHLFDTFTGILGTQAEEGWPDGEYRAELSEVQQNIGKDFTFHKGDIRETMIDVQKGQFALVHLDLDVYRPLADCLPFFYERASLVLVSNVDDAHPGVQKAIREFDKPHKRYSRYALYQI